MLLHDAAFSYLHFVFALILVGALAAEAFVLRLPVDSRVARLLLRIDLFYGVSAVGVIAAGVARVFWGAKGADFYGAQPFFWARWRRSRSSASSPSRRRGRSSRG